MNRRWSKKASLNLSVEAIVIVVIAFTVLGLGLGFVKDQLGNVGKTTTEVQAKIKEQILEDMRTGGKKLAITQEIQLERGKETIETVGVVNTDSSVDKFGIKITPVKKQNPDGTPGSLEDMEKEVIFFYNELLEKELSPTVGDIIPITIKAKSSASGNYLYKVEAYKDSTCPGGPTGSTTCPAYDSRSFFVKIS